MSALSAQRALHEAEKYNGKRRSSNAFWDQASLDNMNGARVVEMALANKWEHEATTRDNLDSDGVAFEIVDSDAYH